MATPSPSPSPPPPHSPSASDPPSPPPPPPPQLLLTSAKKPQPIPWTHQETVHLIQIYQHRWYALKRGPLKTAQWDEVAVAVAARCGYHASHPSKTSTQCRHKMEKLRKRYRSEKQRLASGSHSSWPFFDLMESLQRGPLPISSRPIVPYNSHTRDEDEDDVDGEEEEEEEEEEDEAEDFSRSRSINYILRRPTFVNRFAPERKFSGSAAANGGGGGGAARSGNRREAVDAELATDLAGEIRAFSKRFVGIENMKMELMREIERFRMEMESKRMEMIFESQRKIVDTISRAFGSQKKMKMSEEDC